MSTRRRSGAQRRRRARQFWKTVEQVRADLHRHNEEQLRGTVATDTTDETEN